MPCNQQKYKQKTYKTQPIEGLVVMSNYAHLYLIKFPKVLSTN